MRTVMNISCCVLPAVSVNITQCSLYCPHIDFVILQLHFLTVESGMSLNYAQIYETNLSLSETI